MLGGLSVLPVAGLPEFAPGDDLAAAIAGAAPWLADGDVVVVTSKVVSKVEGRLVHVPPGADRERLRLKAVEDEAVRVVARRGPLAIVQTRQGWVVAAAGIDASNVGQDALVLLPEDADASARGLRTRLRELLGADVGVVVSDTFGRTWREGLTDVAVGSAGVRALIDHRGADRDVGEPLAPRPPEGVAHHDRDVHAEEFAEAGPQRAGRGVAVLGQEHECVLADVGGVDAGGGDHPALPGLHDRQWSAAGDHADGLALDRL